MWFKTTHFNILQINKGVLVIFYVCEWIDLDKSVIVDYRLEKYHK